MELGTPRFALLPLFLLCTVFSVLAPLFWTHVEAPTTSTTLANPENGELYGRVIPTLTYGFGRVKKGEWPLWAASQYGGIPYFANPTHGLFQPLNSIFLFMPVHTALALHAFLGLLLMGLGAALYLRALGTGYIAAMIGGMACAFGGASTTVMSRPELLSVLAWAPLLYWAIYEYSQRQQKVCIVLGGFVVALMLLAGTPLLALLIASNALVYGLVRILWPGRNPETSRRQQLGALGVLFTLGLLLSAAQWVPYVAWLTTLARPAEALWPWNWAGHVPASAAEVAGAFLLPGISSQPEMLYVGVITLVLIPAALLQKHGRPEVIFFALASLLWLGLAIWILDDSAATEWSKALVFPGAFSLAMLAGLGADRLLLTGRDPRSPLIWGSALLMLAAATVTLFLGPADARGRVLVALVVLLPFFLLRVKWMGVMCGAALVFLLFVDLRGASRNTYQHPYAGDETWLTDSLPALWEAEAIALGQRVLTLPSAGPTTLPANIGLMLGVSNAQGDYWPLTAAQDSWWTRLHGYLEPTLTKTETSATGDARIPSLINFMAVRVLVGERNRPWMDAPPEEHGLSIQFLRTMGRLSLWRNNSALPRVRVVHQWRAAADEDALLTTLVSPEFDGNDTCVVLENSPAWHALRSALPQSDVTTEDPGDARCIIQSERPESIEIHVTLDQAGILVLADTYASGWRADIDGKRAEILPVNGLFRGVVLSPGEHVVRFSYRPVSVSIGLFISGFAALACLLWLIRLGIYTILNTLSAWRGNSVVDPPPSPECAP